MSESRVPTMENRMSEIDSGKMRMPVCSASRPRVICRYTGTMKNRPAVIAYCAPSDREPAAQPRDREQRDVDAAAAARSP